MIASLGAVIRDKNGRFVRGARMVRLAFSPIEAEAHAALNGLVVASDLGSIHLDNKGKKQTIRFLLLEVDAAALEEKRRMCDEV
ncbi:unnamed protein product [Prunus armeniaca]